MGFLDILKNLASKVQISGGVGGSLGAGGGVGMSKGLSFGNGTNPAYRGNLHDGGPVLRQRMPAPGQRGEYKVVWNGCERGSLEIEGPTGWMRSSFRDMQANGTWSVFADEVRFDLDSGFEGPVQRLVNFRYIGSGGGLVIGRLQLV